jgi:hypothetical protein
MYNNNYDNLSKILSGVLPVGGILSAITLVISPQAEAAVLFEGSGLSSASGESRSAAVEFEVSGTNLIVTLQETTQSYVEMVQPDDVLTGVAFRLDGVDTTSLALIGADAGSSNVWLNTTPVTLNSSGDTTDPSDLTIRGRPNPDTNLGPDGNLNTGLNGGWSAPLNFDAIDGIDGMLGNDSRNMALGTAGFSNGNPSGDGIFRDNPSSVGGLNYGLVGPGFSPGSGNNPVDSNEVIQSSITFTLSNLPAGFLEENISEVWFQYGTDVGQTGFAGILVEPEVPEPRGILPLLAIGFLLIPTGKKE